jgi:hypothetical protein
LTRRAMVLGPSRIDFSANDKPFPRATGSSLLTVVQPPVGVKLGRPKIDSAIERKVRRHLAKILKVAKSLGIGTGTVQRIAKELR